MAFYRLKASLCVQNVTSLPARFDPRFQFLYIEAGAIVEAISTPNQSGRLLIRHHGHSYRAWKEELQNAQIAERLLPTKILNGHVETPQC